MLRMSLIAALLVTIATPATAEILAVCGKINRQAAAHGAVTILSSAQTGEDAASAPQAQLALVRDGQGFDLLLNWGDSNQRSLRAEGADIVGNELGADLVHLVVARAKAHRMEHFLFSLRDYGFGELVWTAASDAKSDASEIVTAESVCVRPH